MNHLICLNTNSFPAKSVQQADTLFEDALYGMLELNKGHDLFTLYLDNETASRLADFILATDYTYQQFLDKLQQTDPDLHLFLLDLEDKSPAFDYIDENIFNEMAEYTFYMPKAAVTNSEIFNLAYFLDATLLSINTSDEWSKPHLNIARTEDGRFIDEQLQLHHISCYQHGQYLYKLFEQTDITQICKNCILSNAFIDWYQALDSNNQRRVINKYRFASCQEINFQGGKPLFDTLTDSKGIREIRFSAYSGGAIRILFKALAHNKQAILLGFIKKSNSGGYTENIPKAEAIFEEIKSH